MRRRVASSRLHAHGRHALHVHVGLTRTLPARAPHTPHKENSVNWPDLAVLALVAASYVGIALLRRRHLNFSVITLLALVVGIAIGLIGRGHADYIEPIGRIYINLLLATVGTARSSSRSSRASCRSAASRSCAPSACAPSGWLMLSNALAVVLALGARSRIGNRSAGSTRASAANSSTSWRTRYRASPTSSWASSPSISSATSAPTTSSRSS